MSEKTPEQVAQEAQEGLNKLISSEAQKLAQQHIGAVNLRAQSLQLAMPFFKDKSFDNDIFPVAEAIMKFLASGTYDKKD